MFQRQTERERERYSTQVSLATLGSTYHQAEKKIFTKYGKHILLLHCPQQHLSILLSLNATKISNSVLKKGIYNQMLVFLFHYVRTNSFRVAGMTIYLQI